MMLVFEPDSLKKYKNLLHIFGALDMTPSGVISSVGRALRLHRRCREFESLITHHVLNLTECVNYILNIGVYETFYRLEDRFAN